MRGMGAAEPKMGASAWNIKACLKPLLAETISHAQPLYQPPCQREFAESCCCCTGTCHCLWCAGTFHLCWSVCGVLMTSDDMEMKVKGLRSPKVSFSDVIFSFYFHRCWLQDEKAVSFGVIHNPKRHFLNFMPASRAFLFMRLNWLASEKPHSWYLFSLEICGQRDPCQHYTVFQLKTTWQLMDQVHWSSLGGVFPCKDLTSHLPSTVIVKPSGLWYFQSDLLQSSAVSRVNAATGNERMLMLWGGMDMNN